MMDTNIAGAPQQAPFNIAPQSPANFAPQAPTNIAVAPAQGAPNISGSLSGARQGNYDALASEIKAEYPGLASIPFTIMESDGPGKSETFPSFETKDHPLPGQNVIQLRSDSKRFTPQQRKSMVTGELLHVMGAKDPDGKPVNPGFRKFKDAYVQSLTPDQWQFHHRVWRNQVNQGEETRSFEDWMDVSRVDQFIGAFLFPNVYSSEFDRDTDFTPEQQKILGQAEKYLKQKGVER